MKTLKLDVQKRTILGKQSGSLRDDGIIPAVVYGHSTESTPISLALAAFEKCYREAGESSLIDLSIDNAGSIKALIHDVQRDAVNERVLHVDFYAVTMTEKLTATIQFKFIGEPKAVKALGGVLVKNLSEVEVRCLPGDLVHEIVIDLSPLQTFEDTITIGDLPIPPGMEILAQDDTIIAVVTPPISEEELKAMDEKPVADVSAVEKVDDKKKEEKEDTKK
ncbi:MAG: 50S ribosomal protein L25 [bacterium]|nr:50S ribosomal protein L25 [bacterium]